MRLITILFLLIHLCFNHAHSQQNTVTSPNKKVAVYVESKGHLTYQVMFSGKVIVDTSLLGFEFQNEPNMVQDFEIVSNKAMSVNEKWKPIVKSKHSEIENVYNELELNLKEKSGKKRCMDFFVRAYNDGIAFRYKLYRGEKIGNRKIKRELTAFNIPNDPTSWIAEYGGYSSSQEGEFLEYKLSHLGEKSIAGLPLLMKYKSDCWVAVTEAKVDNYAGFYLGTTGKKNQLTTKLAPLPGESEEGIKVEFDDDIYTPWRVIMIGQTPGDLIESEIVQNLNDSCAIKDPYWIKPGKSSWDNWWSGDVKMEMSVIKDYIDFSAQMGWEYMIVDWQWYGAFNTPDANILKWAPQIDMPEIIRYAKSKNIKIILWLYSSDVNQNSAYKEAFPLYKEWGVAGVKIDFMDRDDQQMVNWYHDIVRFAAKNQLLVDFHGAYKPDGIIRTYPNLITREGVMGNEYNKFSNNMSAEHNVNLAFTRMLAGQMDYTPGGFLNVPKSKFKKQLPTLVSNTRAAELSKFVIYESPLTVVCDHPSHILNKPGSDFLKIVPTVWDDTKFIGGYPGNYVAIARRSGDKWFIGIMNGSKGKQVEIKLDFLESGSYQMDIWADSKDSNVYPEKLKSDKRTVKSIDKIKVTMSDNGGFVCMLKKL